MKGEQDVQTNRQPDAGMIKIPLESFRPRDKQYNRNITFALFVHASDLYKCNLY